MTFIRLEVNICYCAMFRFFSRYTNATSGGIRATVLNLCALVNKRLTFRFNVSTFTGLITLMVHGTAWLTEQKGGIIKVRLLHWRKFFFCFFFKQTTNHQELRFRWHCLNLKYTEYCPANKRNIQNSKN